MFASDKAGLSGRSDDCDARAGCYEYNKNPRNGELQFRNDQGGVVPAILVEGLASRT
jgi:hypothetical protein